LSGHRTAGGCLPAVYLLSVCLSVCRRYLSPREQVVADLDWNSGRSAEGITDPGTRRLAEELVRQPKPPLWLGFPCASSGLVTKL
jgi:hypothetical protein